MREFAPNTATGEGKHMSFWSFLMGLFKKKPSVTPVAPVVVQPIGGVVGKKAVLVGINQYSNAPLAGCVNDALKMKKLLIEKYGFKAEEIRMLLDKAATTKNITDALVWLADSKSGDMALFCFSGHGTQVPNANGEPDGLSECICPIEFDWTPQRMIIDKQFVEIFAKMPSGVMFNWISDSCHSGDLDRFLPRQPPMGFFAKMWAKIAFWKTPVPVKKARSMPVPPHVVLQVALLKNKGLKAKGFVGGLLDVGYVSGCRSDQTSADTVVAGVPCGALTYYFERNVRGMPGASLKAVVEATNKDLEANGYTQRPQVTGARVDKPFLS